MSLENTVFWTFVLLPAVNLLIINFSRTNNMNKDQNVFIS